MSGGLTNFDQAQQAPVQHIIEVTLHVPLIFCNLQNTNQFAEQEFACPGRRLSVILTYNYPFCVPKQIKNYLKHLQLLIHH